MAKDKKPMPLMIGAIVVVLLIVVGAFFFMRSGGNNPLSMNSENPEELVANALTGSGSVKCTYTTEEGQTVTAYVRGGMVRTDMTGGADGDGSFLMKDNTMWMWQSSTNEGMIIKIPETTPDESMPETEETESTQADEIKEELKQYQQSCINENFSDSVFEVPTDVSFQDFSQMMQSGIENRVENKMEEVKENINTENLPEEVQQYLNQ